MTSYLCAVFFQIFKLFSLSCLDLAARCYASAALAVMQCLSVCLSVMFLYYDKTNKRIIKIFFTIG